MLLLAVAKSKILDGYIISSNRYNTCFGNDKQGIYFTIYKPFSAPSTSYKVNLRYLGAVIITVCL